MRQPDFFIVGAPKCGTTAMYEYLRKHPEIFMPEKKEPHFFGSDLNFGFPRITKERYLSLFVKALAEKMVGEASAWYLYSNRASLEIKAFCPSARIIIMLRNPVDMLYSLHSHQLYHGTEDIEDFEAALDAESDRTNGLRIPTKCPAPSQLFYCDVVKYTEQVERYLNVFGKDKVYIIIFDDFKNDTLGIYRKTLRFLEVNPDFQPDFLIVNPNKRAYSKTLQHYLAYRPRIVKWFGNTFMPSSLRDGLLNFIWNLNTGYVKRPRMDPQLRTQLMKKFTPEVQSLSKLIGRDLLFWVKE